MKTKLFFTLLLVAALCFYGCTETEYVYVTSDDGSTTGTNWSSGLEGVDDVCTKMTDEHFKEYCYENFDADNDGKVSMKEAELVTEIYCSTAEDFTGIEYFTNLESFTSQSVKYIDLSRNILLSYICLRYSQIEILDLSHNVNLTELPKSAFDECIKLTSIALPESLTAIGDYAFYGCDKLEEIIFPKGLTSIGRSAFAYCEKLTTITFPENLVELGIAALGSCTNITAVTFTGNDMTVISNGTFENCESLMKVILPDGVTSIGYNAFYNCSNLTEVTLPASLTSIGNLAFWNCTSLITVSSNAVTPPALETSAFDKPNNWYIPILYVLSESIEAYANSDWSYYFDIILAIDDDFPTQDGDGTRENPYTVSQALEMLNSETYDPDKGYYVKGYVSCQAISIGWFEGLYTIGYYMSEDGHHSEESDLFVHIGFDLGGEYFTSQDALSAGDKVIVYGRFGIDELNNDRREMACGKLYYWNGEFGELDDDEYFMEHGDGSKENPYSVSQAVEMLNSGTYDPDKNYYVKGIVSMQIAPYMNSNFYISDDGYYWRETNLFVYDFGGELFSYGDVMSPLDQVIVYGKLSLADNSYYPYAIYAQPIMDGGKMYYWNGKTADVE